MSRKGAGEGVGEGRGGGAPEVSAGPVINSFRKKNVMQTYDALIGHAYLPRRVVRRV